MRDKIKVELPDLLKYYDVHVKKHEFDRPATITWREIVIEPIKTAVPRTSEHDSTALPIGQDPLEAARSEAAALLAQAAAGEDFATLAIKNSDGPAAAQNKGGLMETSPGGYMVPAVNKALESLPIGQVSDVIEGPDGFHIVRVESAARPGL